jgi:hypothetical protein
MKDKVSTEADKSAPLGDIEIDRTHLLSLMSEILRAQHKRALNGRVRNEKLYKLRMEAIRVFSYAASVYSGILRDKELTDIEARLETLEVVQNAK